MRDAHIYDVHVSVKGMEISAWSRKYVQEHEIIPCIQPNGYVPSREMHCHFPSLKLYFFLIVFVTFDMDAFLLYNPTESDHQHIPDMQTKDYYHIIKVSSFLKTMISKTNNKNGTSSLASFINEMPIVSTWLFKMEIEVFQDDFPNTIRGDLSVKQCVKPRKTNSPT
jgi:hypothetical protein